MSIGQSLLNLRRSLSGAPAPDRLEACEPTSPEVIDQPDVDLQLPVLRRCSHAWGAVRVLTEPLKADAYERTLFMPFSRTNYFAKDPTWGIYNSSGELIEAAALRLYEHRELVGQSETTPLAFEHAELAPEGDYVYGGPFVLHYGHFICTTLARLWYAAQGRLDGAKVVFHSHQDVDAMLAIPHVRACFEKLGLNAGNIIVPERPTRFDRLIIPEPAFEEQSFVHPAYRETCRLIGGGYVEDDAASPLPPVYLSKTALTKGVGRISNEGVIEDYLYERGVEIIYPEKLSWAEQVRLFSQRRVIAGTTGSAFHTSIFAPARARLICLSTSGSVNSNLLLADAVNGTAAIYTYPESGNRAELSNVDDFLTLVTLAQPAQVARDLADLITRENTKLGGPPPEAWTKGPPRPVVDKLSFATRNLMRDQIAAHGWTIGAHTYGAPEVLEAEHGHLRIGRFCSISSKVIIVLGRHRSDTVSSYPFFTLRGIWPGAEGVGPDHVTLGGVEIGNDVWIGYGAMILPGAKIGDGCFIQSGAVVDGSVPAYAIVAGNPGVVVGMRFDDETIRLLRKVAWWDWDEPTLERFMPVLASGEVQRFLASVEEGGYG